MTPTPEQATMSLEQEIIDAEWKFLYFTAGGIFWSLSPNEPYPCIGFRQKLSNGKERQMICLYFGGPLDTKQIEFFSIINRKRKEYAANP